MKNTAVILIIMVLSSMNLSALKNNPDPINSYPGIQLNNYSILQSEKFFRMKSGVLGGISFYILNNNGITLNGNNNLPQYNFSVNNAEMGIHFGLFTQMFLGNLFIRPELTFNSNVINYKLEDLSQSSADQIIKERYQYLDIPVLLGYKAGSVRFNAGPVGHFFLANKSNLTNIDQFSTDFKSLTLGYQLGIGIDFFNLMLDLRYEGNFSKIGEGILFYGNEVYFDKSPGRIMASISFAIR